MNAVQWIKRVQQIQNIFQTSGAFLEIPSSSSVNTTLLNQELDGSTPSSSSSVAPPPPPLDPRIHFIAPDYTSYLIFNISRSIFKIEQSTSNGEPYYLHLNIHEWIQKIQHLSNYLEHEENISFIHQMISFSFEDGTSSGLPPAIGCHFSDNLLSPPQCRWSISYPLTIPNLNHVLNVKYMNHFNSLSFQQCQMLESYFSIGAREEEIDYSKIFFGPDLSFNMVIIFLIFFG